MNIVVFTSDRYLPSLRPFCWLFNKYWSPNQSVTIVGFAEPSFSLPSNFSFHSMGDMKNFPMARWSNAVMDYLELRSDMESAIILLDDYWLVRRVNVEAVRMCYDYTLQFKNVLKFDLAGDRLYAWGMTDFGNCGYLDLIKSHPDSQYGFSLMAGVWNRELILKFMRREESCWSAELEGTSRVSAAGDSILVLGSRQWPVRHTLAHRGGNPGELFLSELNPIDVEELTNLGYIPY